MQGLATWSSAVTTGVAVQDHPSPAAGAPGPSPAAQGGVGKCVLMCFWPHVQADHVERHLELIN